ncbi:MAG: GDP-mannose 4,6-dehydratase [Firmicutes bacterium]|nr:GDP-mannose 4,6-dehydratase [Bacillota bacterium]
MNIIVTGGAGFIGSHITDAFINAGHHVIVVDNLVTGKLENINPKAEFVKIDINDPDMEKVFSGKKIDAVCHHAAQMDVRKSVADPVFDANTNVLGTIKLLENCRKYEVGNLMFSSTGGVIYGEPDYIPVEETYPTRPMCAYGVSKLCGEHYIQYYGDLYGQKYTIFRYGNVFGPRQDPHGEAGVVAIFSGLLLQGRQCKIFGSGEARRDYIHISDVVRANMMALETKTCEVMNIGTGVGTSVNELYERMRAIVDIDLKPIYEPDRPGEINRIAINPAKAGKVLGWEPKVDMNDGLRETIDYFRQKAKAAV